MDKKGDIIIISKIKKCNTREYMNEYMKKNVYKYLIKIPCACGSSYSCIHRARHIKCQKHIRYLQQQSFSEQNVDNINI